MVSERSLVGLKGEDEEVDLLLRKQRRGHKGHCDAGATPDSAPVCAERCFRVQAAVSQAVLSFLQREDHPRTARDVKSLAVRRYRQADKRRRAGRTLSPDAYPQPVLNPQLPQV